MKSFFVAMAILLALIISGLAFNTCLNGTANTLLANCGKINNEIEAENFEGAYQDAEAISEYIDENKGLLSSILDHSNIDQIEQEVSELLGYTKKQDLVNSVVSIKKLTHLIEHLPENYALRLQNIL